MFPDIRSVSLQAKTNKGNLQQRMNVLASECQVLKEMLETGTATDKDGQPVQMHSQIYPHFAEALYQTVLRHRPRVVVEIGMALCLIARHTHCASQGGG